MREIGWKKKIIMIEFESLNHPVTELEEMPELKEDNNLVCGFRYGAMGEKMIVVDTPEDLQELNNAYRSGVATGLSWYQAPVYRDGYSIAR